MATVLPQETRNQVTTFAGQTIITYQFQILNENDIDVWKTLAGQTPDPDSDKLTVNQDFTVTGVGTPTGGTVVLTDAAAVNDTVTEERDTIIQRDTDFTLAGNFTAAEMNRQLDILTMISQEIDTTLKQRGLTYQPTDQLGSDRKDNILPVLLPNSDGKISIWSKAAGGALVALQLDEDDDVNTLRSELASEVNGADGALLVGYFDSIGGGKTIKEKLDEINTFTTDLSANADHATCGATLVGYNADSSATTVRDELDLINSTRTVPLSAALNGSAYIADTIGSIFPLTAYVQEALFLVKFDLANPGAVSLDINSVGSKNLMDMAGNALVANYILANTSALVYYDVAAGQFRILSQSNTTLDEWATQAEVRADAAIQKGVYLQNFEDHPGIARAWINFRTSTASVLSSYGFDAVNVGGSGWDFILHQNMINSVYAIIISLDEDGGSPTTEETVSVTNRTVNSFRVTIHPDLNDINLVVFGQWA